MRYSVTSDARTYVRYFEFDSFYGRKNKENDCNLEME